MHRNKDLYLSLREDAYDEQEFEVTKGSYKTKVVCRFNRKGHPIWIGCTADYQPTEKDNLEREMNRFAAQGDYVKAGEIQLKLKDLK